MSYEPVIGKFTKVGKLAFHSLDPNKEYFASLSMGRIDIYTQVALDQIAANKLEKEVALDDTVFFGSLMKVKFDARNQIIMPPELIKQLLLDEDVMCISLGERFSIINASLFDQLCRLQAATDQKNIKRAMREDKIVDKRLKIAELSAKLELDEYRKNKAAMKKRAENVMGFGSPRNNSKKSDKVVEFPKEASHIDNGQVKGTEDGQGK